MNEFLDDSDKEREAQNEDLRYALYAVDPQGRISARLEHYRERMAMLELGVHAELDRFGNDPDTIYSDSELADRYENLKQSFKAAVIAMAALSEANRHVSEWRRKLEDRESHAQYIAHKTLSEADVTIADLFPSEIDKSDDE